jgi:uncharacterized protein (TIGR03435 family)
MDQIINHASARWVGVWKRRALALAAAGSAFVALLAVGVLIGARLRAQALSATAPLPSFEVASVKPNTSDDRRIQIGAPGPNRMVVTNAPLRELIRLAYQVQPFQLEGGPGWIDAQRFDINATLPESSVPAPLEQRWLMMRQLLAERFKLMVHTEMRDAPIYELVLARSDGRLGDKLRISGPDCAPLSFPAGRTMPAAPPPPPGAANRPPAGPACPTMIGPGFITTRRTTLTQLSRTLGNIVRRTVVDKTGLTDSYDADVEYSPEFRPVTPPGFPAPPDVPSDGPSIFTALQEQLGLKLESARGPVEMIVIDSVDALIPD